MAAVFLSLLNWKLTMGNFTQSEKTVHQVRTVTMLGTLALMWTSKLQCLLSIELAVSREKLTKKDPFPWPLLEALNKAVVHTINNFENVSLPAVIQKKTFNISLLSGFDTSTLRKCFLTNLRKRQLVLRKTMDISSLFSATSSKENRLLFSEIRRTIRWRRSCSHSSSLIFLCGDR